MARSSTWRWWLLVAMACGHSPSPPPPVVDAGQPEGWDQGIAPTLAVDTNPDPHVVEVTFEARVQDVEIKPGLTLPMWTYNGQVPGPLIRANKGDRLVVHLINHLPEPTTIHWHGVRVPAAMDGTEMSQTPVPAGGTFDYDFVLPDAGTFWYHPHVHSSAQVGFGLYGALVVEDPDEPKIGDALVLVLSDVSVTPEGTLSPGDESGWFGDYFGREGGVLLVNGRVLPTVKARAGLPQRWRVVNTARSKYFKFNIPGAIVDRVGGDGGLLEKPLRLVNVVLGPGERADLRVTPTTPGAGPITIFWEDTDRFHISSTLDPVPLLKLQMTADSALTPPALPGTLRTLERLDTSAATTRTIELMEKSADGGAVLGINGLTYQESTPVMVHLGDTEIWKLSNSTNFDHPFHLHGYFFQVMDIKGVAPPLEWKDTVTVPPATPMRLAVRFDDRPGMWMFHCHILDHAELGMMQALHVMEP